MTSSIVEGLIFMVLFDGRVIKAGIVPVKESFITEIVGWSSGSASLISGKVKSYGFVNYIVISVKLVLKLGGVFLMASIVKINDVDVESGRVPVTLIG